MNLSIDFSSKKLLIGCVLTALSALGYGRAQQPKSQNDDVIRTTTELVQTAITVVDKNGRFVDGLDRSQFELEVDGQPRPISFFERITAGSARDAQFGIPFKASDGTPIKPASVTIAGRSIVFFIDDMHMSAESLHRTRDVLRHFLDSEMASKDSVAIASASGQIGFLQQFTNNREVLSAAIERLAPRQYEVRGFGTGSTKMKEFEALVIDTANPKTSNETLNYYVRECIVQANPPKEVPSARALIAASCDTDVRSSARAVLMQAGALTLNMYASLESLMRSSARARGR